MRTKIFSRQYRPAHLLALMVLTGWIALSPHPTAGQDNPATLPAGDSAITTVPGIDGDYDQFRITPDGKHLLVLQPCRHRLVKISLEDITQATQSPRLATGLSTMDYALDNQRILVGSAPRGYLEHRPGHDQRGTLQWLDSTTLKPTQPPHTILNDIAEVVCLADGQILVVSGSDNGDKTIWSVLNESATAEVHRHVRHRFGWWGQHHVFTTTSDRRVVFTGSKAKVNGADVGVLFFGQTGAPLCGQALPVKADRSRGVVSLIDNERFLMTMYGHLVRLANHPHGALQAIAKFEHNTGAVVSRELGVLALCVKNGLDLYRWPSLEPMRTAAITGQLEYPQAVADSGVFFARHIGSETEEQHAPGDLVRVDLAKLLTDEEIQPTPDTPAPLPSEQIGLPATTARLPLHADLKGLHLSADGQSLLTFDAGEGKAYRINRETLAVEASSSKLPYGSHNMAYDTKSNRLVVLCAPERIPKSMSEPIPGQVIWLDAQTLEQIGEAQPTPVTPRLATFDQDGELYLAGEFDDDDSWQIRRVDKHSNQFAFYTTGRGFEYLQFGPDGKTLFFAGGQINYHRVHPTPDASMEKSFLPSESRKAYMGGKFFFSNTGFYIASSPGGILQFTEKTDKYGKPLGSLGELTAMTGDPPLLITGTGDGKLHVARVPECQIVATADFKGVITDLVYHTESGKAYGLYWPDRFMVNVKYSDFNGPTSADIIAIDFAELKEKHATEE